jgi:hypothetical protein
MFESFCREFDGLWDHPHVKIRHALTLFHHERVDRKGPEGINIMTQPLYVQAACIADAYDGDMILRPHQGQPRSPEETLRRLLGETSEKYHGAFDEALLRRYVTLKEKEHGFHILTDVLPERKWWIF